jgi:hypothetical protein
VRASVQCALRRDLAGVLGVRRCMLFAGSEERHFGKRAFRETSKTSGSGMRRKASGTCMREGFGKVASGVANGASEPESDFRLGYSGL